MVTKQSTSQRFKGFFSRSPKPADAYKEIVEDQRRSQIYPFTLQNNVIEPEWDYNLLMKYSKYNEDLRTTHEALIKEATRNGGAVKPRWMSKCPVCGSKYQTEKEKCPECEVETVKPDLNQKQLLEAFIEDPNSTDEIKDIQISCYRFMFGVSDWYISIQPSNLEKLLPFTIQVEDAAKMRICVDKHGNLGNGEFFCPKCTVQHPNETWVEGKPCPHCGGETKETAYMYIGDGPERAHWAKDEMLHSNFDPNLPSRYGLSRVVSALRAVMCTDVMDQFNYDNYSDGKLSMMLGFEGLDQSSVNELMQTIAKQRNKPEYDGNLGRWITRKLRVLGIGMPKGLVKVDTMPDAEKMQNLEWRKLWRETVNGIYGVQDVVAGSQQQGTTGQNPRMKIDVNNNTTELIQHAWSDPFNNVIVKALGVSDWVYEFNPVEEKDEAQDVAVLQAKLIAIQTAISLGMDAELTDEQEVKISGKPLSLEEKQAQTMEVMKQQSELAAKNNPVQEGGKSKDTAFESKNPIKKENVFVNEKGRKKWIVYESPIVQAMTKADDIEGTWVTINGVHILIKDGETAADAFKRTTGKDLDSSGSEGDGGTKTLNTPNNQVINGERMRITTEEEYNRANPEEQKEYLQKFYAEHPVKLPKDISVKPENFDAFKSAMVKLRTLPEDEQTTLGAMLKFNPNSKSTLNYINSL
jgi:hypothetical protein